VKALKEMVFLPLVYPEVFAQFNVSPPRGVLLYGPPGTGKTLIARALAASAARSGTKVAFFMRKGADVLSKWVGEAERQLKMLFEEASRQQPSIIFFDEIDGLAPVRSSRQDQIHNSIVSTLLALMDGLDPRGQVVVLGATNRPDAVDGALRRPGRFDRELAFTLPNLDAREAILDIHTRKWAIQPEPGLRQEMAQACVGYCGADLKALCTESMLRALRRSFPQIYVAEEKLVVDPTAVQVLREDFLEAHSSIKPAAHRAAASHAHPLSLSIAPLLQHSLAALEKHAHLSLPMVVFEPSGEANAPGKHRSGSSLRLQLGGGLGGKEDEAAVMAALASISNPTAQRPRLLLAARSKSGLTHVAPALLHALEVLNVL
jgi:SpoVK/Ycf46/Vps4 family AAA+-type ATPase